MDECNKIIHENVRLLMAQRNLSQNEIIERLAAYTNQAVAEKFFTGEYSADGSLIIALSKVFGVNVNFFVEAHDPDIPVNSKIDRQMRLVEVMKLLGVEGVEAVNDTDALLRRYVAEALDKELVSISYAAYLLNCSVQEVMELNDMRTGF